MRNKKAQVSETMTWVVATLAIIVVLIISISVVQFQLKIKKFSVTGNSDLLVTKSFTGFLSTDDFGVLKKVEDKKGYPYEEGYSFDNDFIKLAGQIFPVLHSKIEREGIYWMGIVNGDNLFGKSVTVLSPDFGGRFSVPSGEVGGERVLYSNIKLNGENYLELLIKTKNEK